MGLGLGNGASPLIYAHNKYIIPNLNTFGHMWKVYLKMHHYKCGDPTYQLLLNCIIFRCVINNLNQLFLTNYPFFVVLANKNGYSVFRNPILKLEYNWNWNWRLNSTFFSFRDVLNKFEIVIPNFVIP